MSRRRVVWVDGALRPEDQAALLPGDRGFTLGDGVFETLLVRGGIPFRLDAHLARLERGARVLGIRVPGGLREAAIQVLEANGVRGGALRMTLSRGPSPPGLAPARDASPTAVVSARPHVSPPDGGGLRVIVGGGRIAEEALTAGIKGLGYGERIAALDEALRTGADDALLRNGRGDVVGGTASNVLVYREGTLTTPSDRCGALPGITREAVLEVAGGLGISWARSPVSPAMLSEADEVLLTSSLRGPLPVTLLDGRPVGSGAPGPAWRRLREGYRALVERETARG